MSIYIYDGMYFLAACLYSDGVRPVTFLKAEAKAVLLLNPTSRQIASIVRVLLQSGLSRRRHASLTRRSVSTVLKFFP